MRVLVAVIAFVFVLLRFPLRHLVGEKKAAKMLLLLLFLLPLSAFTTLRLAVRHGARERRRAPLTFKCPPTNVKEEGGLFQNTLSQSFFQKRMNFLRKEGRGETKKNIFSKTLNATHEKEE